MATAALWYVVVYAAAAVLHIGLLSLDVQLPERDVIEPLRNVRVPEALAWAGLALGSLALVGFCAGMIALSVRRFHDMGFIGFLILLFPLLVLTVPDPAWWPSVLPGATHFVWNGVLLVVPGTRGANRFGAAPNDGEALLNRVFE